MLLYQPIVALEHPKFHQMINIASRAKNGVKIPAKKATRKEIIQLFREHLQDIKERINVCNFFCFSEMV